MQTLTIDPAHPGRTFEGLGAVSAGASSRLLVDYPEPQRSEILDLLFAPGRGAGLQHLKVEIGADTNSTDGAEPSHARSREDRDYTRGYEWWLMREARRRNPDIVLEALCWGAPGWLGGGVYHSQDTADYVADFLDGACEHHGLDIAYVGVWNEMNHDVAWIKLLARTLRERGLATKLVVGDGFWEPIVADLDADPELRAVADAVGAHYPRFFDSPEVAKRWGTPLWSSEDGPWDKVEDGMSGEWQGARELARICNRNYVVGRMTKTLVWSPVTAYYDNLMIPGSGLMRANEPWSGHYRAQPALWAMAHTTRFAAPGWRYLDPACGFLDRGGSYVTLVSPDGAEATVVLETVGADRPQRIELAGLARELRAWLTTEERSFAPLGPVEGVVELPPEAVLTISTVDGGERPRPAPPASAPFPFPYRDDFAGPAAPRRAPRYLSDQEGAFELADGCLEQVVLQPPIPWTGNILSPGAPAPTPADNPARPYTVLGDPAWRDYEVSVEAEPLGGEVAVMGRVSGPPPTRFEPPGRYELRLGAEGWSLLRVARWDAEPVAVLASGPAPVAGEPWRRLALRFEGPRIEASIDGARVAQVEDTRFEQGSAGLGSGWNRARFRRFAVEEAT